MFFITLYESIIYTQVFKNFLISQQVVVSLCLFRAPLVVKETEERLVRLETEATRDTED